MDSRIYLVVIVILAALLVYFLIIAPGPSTGPKVITTTIPLFNQNTTTNSTNNTSTIPQLNESENFSASKVGWVATTPYPTPTGQQKCLYYDNYTYCIGGTNNVNYTSSTFFSQVTNKGLGGWTESIPMQIIPVGCILYYNVVYCITGKLLSNHSPTNNTYYSYVNKTGFSIWNQTTTYPINGTTNGCAASGIRVYCVGGTYANSIMTANSYYAPISRSGIGTWVPTIPFPIKANPQCFITSFTIYCMGSYLNANQVVTGYAYYAPVTATGFASWKATAPPPNLQGYINCDFYSPFVYCLGGIDKSNYSATPVFYTGLSAGGVNGWHQAPSYPISNGTAASCITSNNTTFCIGGEAPNLSYTSSVYYTRSFI